MSELERMIEYRNQLGVFLSEGTTDYYVEPRDGKRPGFQHFLNTCNVPFEMDADRLDRIRHEIERVNKWIHKNASNVLA